MPEIVSHTPAQTRALGRCLGNKLAKGIVIRLCGELGSGKTCFVQGLAEGLDVPDAYDVTSPTYTLINEYPGRLPLYHIDLYRLAGPADAETIGFWDIIDADAVVAVEWAERIADDLWPPETIRIEFSLSDDDAHRIRLNGYGLGPNDLISEAVELWEAILH